VCEAFQSATVVFVGKVTDIKSSDGTTQEATFAVTEKLKGNPTDVETVEGGGMCGTVFQKGKTYFVYATSSGHLTSSLCGRTATIDRAKEDLAYARTASSRSLAMIGGVVTVNDPQGYITLRAGATVRAQKKETKTDKLGRFTLEVPPGKYTLEVIDAKARLPLDYADVVNVADAASCAHRDLTLVWNGKVRGRVVSTEGKPVEGVQLTLSGANGARVGNMFATTDAKGQYELSGVQAGEYILVAYSAHNVPTTTFYPSVDDPAKAKAVKLSQAGVVQRIDIKLLP
jgi:hypothetical protein